MCDAHSAAHDGEMLEAIVEDIFPSDFEFADAGDRASSLRVIELQRHRQLQLAPRAQSLLSDPGQLGLLLSIRRAACPSGQKDFILRPSFFGDEEPGEVQFPARPILAAEGPEIGDHLLDLLIR